MEVTKLGFSYILVTVLVALTTAMPSCDPEMNIGEMMAGRRMAGKKMLESCIGADRMKMMSMMMSAALEKCKIEPVEVDKAAAAKMHMDATVLAEFGNYQEKFGCVLKSMDVVKDDAIDVAKMQSFMAKILPDDKVMSESLNQDIADCNTLVTATSTGFISRALEQFALSTPLNEKMFRNGQFFHCIRLRVAMMCRDHHPNSPAIPIHKLLMFSHIPMLNNDNTVIEDILTR